MCLLTGPVKLISKNKNSGDTYHILVEEIDDHIG